MYLTPSEGRRRLLLFAVLCSCCVYVLGAHGGNGTCPDLQSPSYASLIFNSSDVTTDQPDWQEGSTVEYRCASGYQLVSPDSGALLSDPSTACQADGKWTVAENQVACRVYDCEVPPVVSNGDATYTSTVYGAVASYSCKDGYSLEDKGGAVVCTIDGWTDPPVCEEDPAVSDREIAIIVGTVLGSLCLILIIVMLLLCCKLRSMHVKLTEGSVAEDEVAFARSKGVVSLSNPLMRMGMKEEDANPLYLTPDELTDFEQQISGAATS